MKLTPFSRSQHPHRRPADRRAGTSSARRSMRVVLSLMFAGTLGCATAGSTAPSVAVQISENVPDATIWIDDRLNGRVVDFSKPGRRLPVGFHRVEVRAPGYYSHFQEVDAKPGTPVSIRADLHQLLD